MTISSGQQSAITAKVRHPRVLVKIQFDETTEIRVASGGTITFNSQVYSKAGVFIDQVKTGKGGIKTMRVHISNEDHIYTKLAVSGNGFTFKPIQAWEYYGTGNPSTDDVVEIMSGEIYGIPEMGQKIVFDCALTGAMSRMIPDCSLGPPDINHMPYPGQTFIIGTEVYTIEIN